MFYSSNLWQISVGVLGGLIILILLAIAFIGLFATLKAARTDRQDAVKIFLGSVIMLAVAVFCTFGIGLMVKALG